MLLALKKDLIAKIIAGVTSMHFMRGGIVEDIQINQVDEHGRI